ncbi:MAG: hypothetical protein JSS72_00045 [Armatimonadetes bacterium]|nr:hypothetical protein [Armatimonadota bacterium]
MAKTITIQPEEHAARAYADRLILEQLSEMESAVKLGELADRLSSHGLGLAAIKSLLATNPARFTYHERRWVPAARIEGYGRPFAEAIRLMVNAYGGPMKFDVMMRELAQTRKQSVEELQGIVTRILTESGLFVIDSSDRISLLAWGFLVYDEPLARALAMHGISQEELAAASKKLDKINWRDPSCFKEALEAAAPMKLKLIMAVMYSKVNQDNPRSPLVYDPAKALIGFLDVPGYILGTDGTIAKEETAKQWIATAVKVADKLAPTVEVEDAAPIEVKATDLKSMVNKIVKSEQSITAIKLLEEHYEITPSNKTFPDDLHNLMSALRGDESIQWVGGDRFRKRGDYPDYILSVPEPFRFIPSGIIDEEGEIVDAELTDDGLSSSLRKLLTHPLATDVLDEDIMPAPKSSPEAQRLVLKSIHRELGTFPMCQIPTDWLDAEPPIQELILQESSGKELQVWCNHETRLLYGFIDWWFDQPIESGAVFTLTRTTKPNVFDFEWMDQPDPVIYISSQRMEELRGLSEAAEGRSTLELLIDVMAHWPKGADYLTLLAEINVVRRSSRRLVASLLSSYQCFYQRSGSPVWHYDAKKLDLGFDKTKRKFVKR